MPGRAPGPAPAADPGPAWLTPWVATAIYFGLALIYFLPAFMPGRQAYGSDFLAGGYPFHDFIAERFGSGALPKWVPYVYGGLPLFANPGSTYHPFRFLGDFLFATHRIFPTIYVLQFALAGIGTYLLSRELGARRWVALVAGLAFQFSGLAMSYVLGGHEGRIIVATSTPLFFFLLHRGVRTGATLWFAGAALTLGMSLLSFQIQSNYYLLLAGLGWGIFALVQVGPRGVRPVAGRVGLGLGAVAVAFMLAAVNFLPFLDYVDRSPRGEGGRGYDYATSWAMPPEEITGLVIPEHVGSLETYRGRNQFKLHTEYAGALVALLAVLGAYYNRRDRYWWFFAGTALVTLSFAFGGHTPIYRLYYAFLPGTAMFRAASISFFLVSVSLVMMAALTLERLAAIRDGPPDSGAGPGARGGGGRGRDDPLRPATWILAGFSALVLVVVLIAGAGTEPEGRAFASGALRFAFFAWLTAGAVWAWLRGRLPTRLAVVVLAALTVVDLWVVDRRYFDTVDGPEFLFAADEVVDFLDAQPGPFRVWVLPPELLRQQAYGGLLKNYLMYHGHHQTGGEHGNQLQSFNQYLGAGQDVYVDWHNVLVDLQVLLDPQRASDRAPVFVRAANIRYLISTVLLPGLPEVFRGRTGVVYEVPGALPRAYMVHETALAPEPMGALAAMAAPGFDPARTAVLYDALAEPLPPGPLEWAAEVVEHEPDRVVVATRSNRAAFLVLADNYYPDWTVTIDGAPAELLRANHTFRGVRVDAGEHRVEFEFRPAALYRGLAVTLVALLLALGVGAADLVRLRRDSLARAGGSD